MEGSFSSPQRSGSLQIFVTKLRTLAALVTIVLIAFFSTALQNSGGPSGQPLSGDITVHSTSVLVLSTPARSKRQVTA